MKQVNKMCKRNILLLTTILDILFLHQASSLIHNGVGTGHSCTYSWKNDQLFADCSHRGLTDVPKLNESVTWLDLSYNHISNISSGSRLPHNIMRLDVGYNNISRISVGDFNNLQKLVFLDISHNVFNYTYQSIERHALKQLSLLRHLNVKNKVYRMRYDGSYLDDVIGDLLSLEHLSIDGMARSRFQKQYLRMKYLRVLDLSGRDGRCYLSYIDSKYFNNLPNLRKLDLSFCEILQIEKRSFHHLKLLEYLDLSHNEEMTFSVLPNVTHDLQFTSIREFRLDKVHCTFGVGKEVTYADTRALQNTSLEVLSIASNRIEMVESGVIRNLPRSLKYLNVGDNMFSKGNFIFEINSLKNLTIVDLTYLFTIHTPKFLLSRCNDTKYSIDNYQRKMSQLNIDAAQYQQNIRSKRDLPPLPPAKFIIYLPPKLETIYANNSNARFLIKEWHLGQNNSIRNLYLQGNILYSLIGPVIGLEKVEKVDISNNFCSCISPDYLTFAPEMKWINMSNNLLGFCLFKDSVGDTFRTLSKLEFLDLSENRIEELPKLIFRNLINLKYLYLRRNLLRKWEPDIKHMTNLQVLDLSNNEIQLLSENTMKVLTATQLTVHLEGNPFLCTCGSVHFLKWMAGNGYIRYDEDGNASCTFSNGTTVSLDSMMFLVKNLEFECSTYTGLIVGCTALVFITTTIIVSGIIYRYRWKLRYLYYMTKRKYHSRSARDNGNEYQNAFKYDAFISYADEDRNFAAVEMRKLLEEENSLNLCIHHRDFVPGYDIAENITNAIHSSRKTVCILSNNYLNSYWCMFELNMARMESIYSRGGEDVLFLVLLKDFTLDSVPFTLMTLIDSKSYIEYPDDAQGNVVFWDKLVETISM